jgi:hypothetical protein
VLGNAQECFHAIECAPPDCEVTPHSSSILSRIVARGKRPYISLAKSAATPMSRFQADPGILYSGVRHREHRSLL